MFISKKRLAEIEERLESLEESYMEMALELAHANVRILDLKTNLKEPKAPKKKLGRPRKKK